MTDTLPVGVRIARRRQALGMKQEDLARKVGVARVTVSNWESGKHPPRRKLGAIEAVLGITLYEEAEPDIMPDGLRDRIRETLTPEQAERVEAAVEAALTGAPMPDFRRRGAGQP
jgi:transcriptional regulator with XRE-family HTH domain